MSDTISQIKEVFARVLETDPAQIEASTSPDSLDAWDSIAHVQLILALEKSFSIKIAPDEGIGIENFDMACRLIESKLGK